jgi:phospholipid/cholesterol/gamma-HCH transport system ATP-binding protein
MTNAVETKDLHKSFGPHHILKGLNINIPKGKITTILGFSGAGKSTFLKHILGLLEPSSGYIKVLGQDMRELDDIEKREFRRNFGMLFQYAALFDSMSAFDNIAFPLREFTKKKEKEIRERVEYLVDSVALEKDSLTRLPSELSGGMRKRVGLARALALSPKIILYDEPTTGLDPITTRMVNDLIQKTAEQNKEQELTSIIISHDVQASFRISDYVAFLERGVMVEYSTVEQFKQSKHPTIRKFLEL